MKAPNVILLPSFSSQGLGEPAGVRIRSTGGTGISGVPGASG